MYHKGKEEYMSDNKRVLLIGDKKSFMVNAIAKGLKDEGFDVLQVLPEVNDISSNIDYSTIWVLYLDSNVGDMFEQLTYIKDSIIGQKLYFFLIGNDDEIEVAQETLPEELIKEIFTRPLNVTVLAASLEKAVDDENKQAERKKILIIDDNPTTLHALQNLLEQNYRVFIASSGMNGISFLVKQEVDLILLDYEMPVADGPKVLEMLHQDGKLSMVPVMFLTGKSDKDSVLKAASLKPVKYLLKSLPPKQLLDEIDQFFITGK